MKPEAWFTLAVVTAMFVVMARGKASPATAILCAVIALLGVGIIEPAEAFAGFSNSAPITVAALYVLARAVEDSGALRPLVRAALGGGTHDIVRLLRLCVPSAAASAFLNNTPIVAMLIRPVSEWAERNGRSASRYLMPLSFAVILGGVVTTIGTSTNLVVSGLLEKSGRAPFGLFEITHVGLPVAIVGLIVVALTAGRLLPERNPPRSGFEDPGRDFSVRMVVETGGPLDGRTVEEAGLRHLEGVFLVEIERDGEPIAPVAPTTVLREGDHLLFVGQARLILDLQNIDGLDSAERVHMASVEAPSRHIVEVVVGRESPLLGQTPKEMGFRERYQAAIVAIHREGQPLIAKLGQVKLRTGDTLLLLTDPGFRERWRGRPDFLVINPLDGEAEEPKIQRGRAAWVGIVAFAVVGLAGSGVLPILQASLLAAVVLVATRALSAGAARDSVEIDVLIVIAASFGLGAAIEQSGLAASLGSGIIDAFSGYGWRVVLLGIVIATVALSEFISNNAAAALMFPIGMATAQQLGADERAFAIAIAVSASNSFLTPIGYQTNTMVYGPGGYRFGDYVRLGLPLTIASVVACVLTA
ncbi:MAG: SLC13 family permease [Deltaproteobacteria bacterium]|nr:SLC13 family permease [Deltaproteobacteria bacterium]